MGYEATGKLYALSEPIQVSERFRKCEFVLEIMENPKYPQIIAFEIVNDKIEQLDGLNIGDEIKVEFNLRGREWRSPKGELRYFNSLSAWRIEPMKRVSATTDKTESRGGAHESPSPSAPDVDGDIPY